MLRKRKNDQSIYTINLIKWCDSTFEINRQVRLKTSVIIKNLMYSFRLKPFFF